MAATHVLAVRICPGCPRDDSSAEERSAVNRNVLGSIPSRPASATVAQTVEHPPCKRDVVGATPSSSSSSTQTGGTEFAEVS